jgi:hypothetical protein
MFGGIIQSLDGTGASIRLNAKHPLLISIRSYVRKAINLALFPTAMGIKGFLMKPVDKPEMARMVRKVLDEPKW